MTPRISKSLIAIIIISLVMALFSLPDSVTKDWPDNAFFNLIKNPKITLGLDLQGGTQLDYRIDLKNAYAKNKDDDPDNDVRINDIIEGVRTTIERRVNGLGVSEPQIYLSNVAGEQHIIVELAGIKDVEEAKKIVGKTIQLEFKEAKTEADPDEVEERKIEAQTVLDEVSAEGADFKAIAEKTMTSDKKIDFRPDKTQFEPDLPAHYKEILPKMEAGQIHNSVIEGSDGYMITDGRQITEKKGLYIIELVNKEEKDRTITKTDTLEDAAEKFGTTIETKEGAVTEDFTQTENDVLKNLSINDYSGILEINNELRVYKMNAKSPSDEPVRVKASHILIAYAGAERADEETTRTKEEALSEAETLLEEVRNEPSEFSRFAQENSDGPSAEKGGDLGFFGKGQMTKAFEDAAFALDTQAISDVVETEFGYHIIKVTDREMGEGTIDVQILKIPKTENAWQELTDAMAKVTDSYEITEKQTEYKFNEIFFDLSPDPWKSTGLDGSHFKYATVIYGQLGQPQVSIEFDSEGGDMFAELTERLVNQRLAIFVGGELISAPNVNEKINGGSAVITGNYDLQTAMQLANDLNTGAIDAPIILSGQYTISATLGENALETSLAAGLIGLIILVVYMIAYYRLMGIFAVLALVIYSIIIIFILNISGIVMTLAGIAGIILSIGMAVDANILIFERTKEELNSGKGFLAAVTAGFDRAWSSIRDSNVSSLITCAILWFFGNSIIRGFALMLALGIVVSMFTAITVTRKFLQTCTGTALAKNRWLLGVKKMESVNR